MGLTEKLFCHSIKQVSSFKSQINIKTTFRIYKGNLFSIYIYVLVNGAQPSVLPSEHSLYIL